MSPESLGFIYSISCIHFVLGMVAYSWIVVIFVALIVVEQLKIAVVVVLLSITTSLLRTGSKYQGELGSHLASELCLSYKDKFIRSIALEQRTWNFIFFGRLRNNCLSCLWMGHSQPSSITVSCRASSLFRRCSFLSPSYAPQCQRELATTFTLSVKAYEIARTFGTRLIFEWRKQWFLFHPFLASLEVHLGVSKFSLRNVKAFSCSNQRTDTDWDFHLTGMWKKVRLNVSVNRLPRTWNVNNDLLVHSLVVSMECGTLNFTCETASCMIPQKLFPLDCCPYFRKLSIHALCVLLCLANNSSGCPSSGCHPATLSCIMQFRLDIVKCIVLDFEMNKWENVRRQAWPGDSRYVKGGFTEPIRIENWCAHKTERNKAILINSCTS